MPDRPIQPPANLAIRQYTTPVNTEGFYSRWIDWTAGNYVPIERGTKYSTLLDADQNIIDQFPDLYFIKETRQPQNYPYATQIFATDTYAEDSYNPAVEFVSNAVNYPSFTRTYSIRRDLWDSGAATLTIGSPLTALIAIKVLDTGVNYDPATTEIQIDDTVGSGATAEAVVDANGKINSIVITNDGSGYTSVPNITILGDGVGAQAVGIIQPQSAVLVQQKKTELDDQNPLRNEFVNVVRVYESLPGPFVYSQNIDPDGFVVTVATRRNIAANITVAETLVAGAWSATDKKGDDDYVAEEIVTSRTVPGNTIDTTELDEDGVTMLTSKVLQDKTLITTSESIVPGPGPSLPAVWTRVTQDDPPYFRGFALKYGDKVAWQVTRTRALPGNAMVHRMFDKNGDRHTITRTMKDASTITEQQTLVSTTWTSVTSKEITELVSWEVKDSMTVPGVQVPFSDIDEKYGIVVNGYKQVVPATTVASISGGFYIEIKPYDDLRSIKIASKVDTNTLPNILQWTGTQYHSFPPELTDASYNYAEAVCGCADSFALSLIANMKHYAGMVTARYTETFSVGAPTPTTPDQFFPVAHNFGFAWAWACGSTDGDCRVKAGAPTFRIPESLHDTINLTIGITTVNTLPATTPTALPHGSYIVLSPIIERRPFNVWRMVKVEVLVP